MAYRDEDEERLLREAQLQRAVEQAVAAADGVILEASDGSEQQTELLTILVASRFVEKTLIGIRHRELRRQMSDSAVEFRPLSEHLRRLGKTDCLFCAQPATKAACLGAAEIRCCDTPRCEASARYLARTPLRIPA
jgi:hypothetical protein